MGRYTLSHATLLRWADEEDKHYVAAGGVFADGVSGDGPANASDASAYSAPGDAKISPSPQHDATNVVVGPAKEEQARTTLRRTTLKRPSVIRVTENATNSSSEHLYHVARGKSAVVSRKDASRYTVTRNIASPRG